VPRHIRADSELGEETSFKSAGERESLLLGRPLRAHFPPQTGPGDRRSMIDGELPSDQRSPRSGSKGEIPVDFPTGSLGYKVIATMMDETTQIWEPFKRAPTQLTVIAGEPEMKN
jgi:hypothetical protein